MDTQNWFFTPATRNLARAEYLMALACLIVALVLHRESVNWIVAACLYQYIDVVGLFPGAIAHRRSRDGQVGKIYYLLYNFFHSAVTQGFVVLGLWLIFGWQWEYLAIPIHLCADRGLLNNYPKPFGFPWNPKRLPEFELLLTRYSASADHSRSAAPRVSTPTV